MSGEGVRAFGAVAEFYADHLQDLPVFVVSEDANAAWNEAVVVRRTGGELAVMAILNDPRSSLAYGAAFDICSQLRGYDERRFQIEAIERGDLDVHGTPILDRSLIDPYYSTGLRELVRFPQTIVVRSFAELNRLRRETGTIRCNTTCWFPARRLADWSPAAKRDLVVIWAPEQTARAVALHAFALEQLQAEVVIVTRGAPAPFTRFLQLEPDADDIPQVLARAACVLDVNLGDPGWSLAFAQRGIPVAAASTSGAEEWVDGVALYEPWSFRSIAGAVARAKGLGPARPSRQPPSTAVIEESLALARVEPPDGNPLVSIVVPTYNRRAMLEATLREQLVTQTYANIEIVVVNDGGEKVGDLAFDPRIRILDRDVNVGVAGANNVGIQAARGKYIQIHADDDRLYPDHVMVLVAALERTGRSVAHSNTMLCIETIQDGVKTTVYNAQRFSNTVDLAEAYAYHRVAGTMVRRSVYDEVGLWDEKLFLNDLELQIRLAEHYDFVHVPRVTAESWTRGEEQLSTRRDLDLAKEMREMFERHPAPGRPYVAALRKMMLERYTPKTP